jgi:hypothetical protein
MCFGDGMLGVLRRSALLHLPALNLRKILSDEERSATTSYHLNPNTSLFQTLTLFEHPSFDVENKKVEEHGTRISQWNKHKNQGQ